MRSLNGLVGVATVVISFSGLAKSDELKLDVSNRIMIDADYLQKWYDEQEAFNVELRRLQSTLNISYDDWQFKGKADLDLESEKLELDDLYFRYRGWNDTSITFGRQKEAFGLEGYTSSTQLAHIERTSFTQAFSPGRNNGVSVNSQFSNLDWWLGVFDNYQYDADGIAVTGKVSATLLQQETGTFRVGSSFSYRNFEQYEFDLSSNLEMHTAKDYLDTKKVTIEDLQLLGFDAMWYQNNVLLSAEWQQQTLSETGIASTERYSGYTLQASYLFGADGPMYKSKAGKLASPRLTKGARVWEVSSRFSQLDTLANENGMLNENWTLSLNYYFGKDLKLMSAYTFSTSNEASSDNQVDAYGASLRVQYKF
mgnify:CR=1 FL=1